MADTLLPLDPQTLSTEISARFDLSADAEKLLLDGQTADEFFALLQENKHYFDALRMLAAVLHKLFIVDWTCQAIRSDLNQKMVDAEQPLIELAEKWVQEPTEANRRIAMESAEAAGYENPSCWALAAAGWTGGSLAPASMTIVPPADDLTAKAASGALSMIAVQNTAQIENRTATLVDMGLEFAQQPVPEPLYTEETAEAAPPQPAPPPQPVAPIPVAAPVQPPAPIPPPTPVRPVQKPSTQIFKASPKQAPQTPKPDTWSTDPL